MIPKRIQLRRSAGFNLQTSSEALNGLPAVVVSRRTLWGNPFHVADVLDCYDGDHEKAAADVVSAFRRWLNEEPDGQKIKSQAKTLLRGKNLACWCKPGSPCHADVLLEIANQ